MGLIDDITKYLRRPDPPASSVQPTRQTPQNAQMGDERLPLGTIRSAPNVPAPVTGHPELKPGEVDRPTVSSTDARVRVGYPRPGTADVGTAADPVPRALAYGLQPSGAHRGDVEPSPSDVQLRGRDSEASWTRRGSR